VTDLADFESDDEALPLIRHLTDLRNRLLIAIASVLVIFLGLIWFAKSIYQFFSEPLRRFLPDGATMIATEVASPLLTPFKLVLVLSILLAIPVILHQAWCFISPGMYRKEKRFAVPLLLSSVLLFYLVFAFFTSAAPEGVTVMTDINHYLNFILKLFFAFGLAFEIPVATVLMVWSGLTTPDSLRRKRPHVIVGCFVLGMLLTPPDVISQTLLSIPMWMLFELGIVLSSRAVKAGSDDESAAA